MDTAIKRVSVILQAYRLFASASIDLAMAGLLAEHGVDTNSVLPMAGPIVRANVAFLDSGRFVFDDFGESAMAMAVHDRDGGTIDLVAWAAREPDVFATLVGEGLLGLDRFGAFNDAPVTLFTSPIAWLRARCAGVAVLDEDAARRELCRCPGNFTAESLADARRFVDLGIVSAERLLVPEAWRAAA